MAISVVNGGGTEGDLAANSAGNRIGPESICWMAGDRLGSLNVGIPLVGE